jgi:hypothetical protein
VIDSIGFKDKLSWIDDDAHPHRDAMHVVERWTRPDWDLQTSLHAQGCRAGADGVRVRE